ncbi:DUF5776 domain-containing protein [Enterococcus mediterraneensis]|uniref:DUF5776 domain-containing protein n=1 Tax=Enterococcus mediterraneensis TaxID=2364791 RepID=UPI000F06F9A5|nr:DUF5776 domain-containing protein [Enterococcus mediterraneensis]
MKRKKKAASLISCLLLLLPVFPIGMPVYAATNSTDTTDTNIQQTVTESSDSSEEQTEESSQSEAIDSNQTIDSSTASSSTAPENTQSSETSETTTSSSKIIEKNPSTTTTTAEKNLENYLSSVPKQVGIIKETYLNHSADLAEATIAEPLSIGSIVKISSLEMIEGIPVLKTESGLYLTAAKETVVALQGNISSFYSTPVSAVRLSQATSAYSSIRPFSSAVTLSTGTILKPTSIDFSSDGQIFFKTDKGFITADKSIAVQVPATIDNYYTEKPNQVVLLKNDVIYSDADFNNKTSKTVKTGDVVKVNGIQYSSSGYPRLVVNGGFLSANRSIVQKVVDNYSNYYTKPVKKVALKKKDILYTSTAFNEGTKTNITINAGDTVAITGLAFSSTGVPRFKTSRGYLTANKSIVVEPTSKIDQYYSTNPGQVVLKKKDVVYKSVEFSDSTKTTKTYASGSIVKIQGIRYSNAGYPRLMVSGGYLTANKSIVQKLVNNYSNYYTSNVGYVKMKKTDYTYQTADLKSNQRKTQLKKGNVIKITGITYTSSGYPRFKTAKGYLTTNKSIVEKFTLDSKNYYTSAPKQIKLKVNDYYYSSLTFSSSTKRNKLRTGSIVAVSGIELTATGIPRIKTPYGYLTANKKYVTSTSSNEYFNHNAPNYMQMSVGAPMGCVLAATYQSLRYKGKATNVTLRRFMELTPKTSVNPNLGYAGSPFKYPKDYNPPVHQMIFPVPLTTFVKKYSSSVRNISGASPAAIRKEIASGNTVAAYVTSYDPIKQDFKAANWHYFPNFSGNGLLNQHVVTVDGYRYFNNGKGGQYHIVDPYRGIYWIDANKFERSYKLRNFALAI